MRSWRKRLKMKIGIYDIDSTGFPNLAAMKLSAYHRSLGDEVEWYFRLAHKNYDKIYCLSVFSWSNRQFVTSDMICGGTGFDVATKLPAEIDAQFPDYSIYPNYLHSLGFVTRGCIRKCSFCVVPQKEGPIQPYRDVEEVLRPGSRSLILMDNNILAHEHGVKQLERIADMKIRLDCNQGLDCRLVDDSMARLLAKIKWLECVRFSCDSPAMLDPL